MRNDLKLAAFCVQRRAVAAAIFIGAHLGYSQVKHLDSDHHKAETTAAGFVNWILTNFSIDSVVLEGFEGDQESMRAGIYREVEETLRSHNVSIQTVGTSEFLNAFAQAPRVRRQDARDIVTMIWPILDPKHAHPAKLDAVALGLYSQTDRLLQ